MTKDKQDRSLELRQQCTNCGGNGSIQAGFGAEFCPYKMAKCPDCNGTGLIDDHSEEDKPFRVMGFAEEWDWSNDDHSEEDKPFRVTWFAEEWDWSNDEPEPPTIYIAGPMRGYPQYNFPAFDAAEKDLREQGWNVLNPAQMDRDIGFDPNTTVTKEFVIQAILRDTEAIIKHADAVAMLPEWWLSKGAQAEAMLAQWKGIPVYTMPCEGMPVGLFDSSRGIRGIVNYEIGLSMFDYHKKLSQNDSTD